MLQKANIEGKYGLLLPANRNPPKVSRALRCYLTLFVKNKLVCLKKYSISIVIEIGMNRSFSNTHTPTFISDVDIQENIRILSCINYRKKNNVLFACSFIEILNKTQHFDLGWGFHQGRGYHIDRMVR